MKKNEISEIYSNLDEREFRRFGEYVHAPFFGVPDRIVKLYDILCAKKKDVLSGKLSRKDIAAGIFKAGAADTSMRKLYSDLNKEIENFLKYEYSKKHKLPGEAWLIKHFRETGNFTKAKQLANALQKELLKLPPHEDTYKLMQEVDSELNIMEEASEFHKYSKDLQNESDNLDAFYLSRKLYLFQLMYSKEKLNSFVGMKYSANMLGGILEYIEENQTDIKKKYPDIFLKYLMLKMLGAANEEMILEYREYLDSEDNRLTLEQKSDFFSDLYNYLTIRIADGDHRFRKPLLALYKHLDEHGLLFDSGKGKIHLYTYKQVLDTAINLKDMQWAEYFAGKYSAAIGDANRKNIVNLGYAKIYYFKGDMKTARQYLAKVDYRDFIHYLDSKMFLLCIEYDCGNYDEGEHIMDATLKYIKNNKDLPELNYNNSARFIKYMKKLFKLKETDGGDDFEIGRLQKEFDADKGFIYAGNWLREQITELRSK